VSGPNQPAWRRAFDTIERPAARNLEALIQTQQFAEALALAVAVRGHVASRLERMSRRALHRLNLPAASDIKRLLTEIHELDRRWAQDVAVILERVEKSTFEARHASRRQLTTGRDGTPAGHSEPATLKPRRGG
jgi:hypothetical protein